MQANQSIQDTKSANQAVRELDFTKLRILLNQNISPDEYSVKAGMNLAAKNIDFEAIKVLVNEFGIQPDSTMINRALFNGWYELLGEYMDMGLSPDQESIQLAIDMAAAKGSDAEVRRQLQMLGLA